MADFVEFCGDFCFWPLDNFFTQRLPLYYDAIVLTSILFLKNLLVKNTTKNNMFRPIHGYAICCVAGRRLNARKGEGVSAAAYAII